MHRPNGLSTGTDAAAARGVIPCPDCGGKVSLRAPACIHCGRPMDDVAGLALSVQRGTLRSEPPIGADVAGPADPTGLAHATNPADAIHRADAEPAHAAGSAEPSLRPEDSLMPTPTPASPVTSPARATRPPTSPPGVGLPAPAPETRLETPRTRMPGSPGGAGHEAVAAPGSSTPPSSSGPRDSSGAAGSGGGRLGAGSLARSAAKVPAGVGKGAGRATTGVGAAILRDPLAIGALVAGQVALFLSYTAYQRGSTVRGMVFAAVVIVVAWGLGSVAKRRAERAGGKRTWIVLLSRLLVLGSVVLLGLAGYATAKGYLPDVTLPALPGG